MPMTLQEIAVEVGEWSQRNFGDQVSKRYTGGVKLLSLAPFLGLVEELGEYEDAINDAEERDAVGDFGIYLCDWSNRDGGLLPEPSAANRSNNIIGALGKLAHCVLKSHQGIRGFDDLGHYMNERDKAVQRMVNTLESMCQRLFDRSFASIVEETWQRVKLRDWQKNNKSAHEDASQTN